MTTYIVIVKCYLCNISLYLVIGVRKHYYFEIMGQLHSCSYAVNQDSN